MAPRMIHPGQKSMRHIKLPLGLRMRRKNSYSIFFLRRLDPVESQRTLRACIVMAPDLTASNLDTMRVLRAATRLANMRAAAITLAARYVRMKRRRVAELRICWNQMARLRTGPRLDITSGLWRSATLGLKVGAARRDILPSREALFSSLYSDVDLPFGLPGQVTRADQLYIITLDGTWARNPAERAFGMSWRHRYLTASDYKVHASQAVFSG